MDLKGKAAKAALKFVKDDMAIGLGSGSTTAYFIRFLGEKISSGQIKNLVAVATSGETARLAEAHGIQLTSLTSYPELDLTVDGADEVDQNLNLIKGLGHALLREKIIETNSRYFVVIVDESKLVHRLGSKNALPVEIVKFEAETHIRWLSTLGCRAELWLEEDGSPVVTENGNFLARCWFTDSISSIGISDPYELAASLSTRPGIVEHGLFLDMADCVIVAGEGGIQELRRD
jgi:ribose 5-phosphate isomerase A